MSLVCRELVRIDSSACSKSFLSRTLLLRCNVLQYNWYQEMVKTFYYTPPLTSEGFSLLSLSTLLLPLISLINETT
jgi:hypothetical protein